MITKADIEKLAKLSRLKLTEQEKEKYATDMENILAYIKIIDKCDRTRALFPHIAIAFIQQTQPKEWKKLEALTKKKPANKC